MKREVLIEWGIITIALIFGFNFFSTALSFLTQLIVFGSAETEMLLKYFAIVFIYFTAFILLIRFSRQIALLLSNLNPKNDTLSLSIKNQAK